MLKNPCKSTRFYSDTRDRRFHLLCIPEKAGRPHGRTVRCRWHGFFITSAFSNKEIYATGGYSKRVDIFTLSLRAIAKQSHKNWIAEPVPSEARNLRVCFSFAS